MELVYCAHIALPLPGMLFRLQYLLSLGSWKANSHEPSDPGCASLDRPLSMTDRCVHCVVPELAGRVPRNHSPQGALLHLQSFSFIHLYFCLC